MEGNRQSSYSFVMQDEGGEVSKDREVSTVWGVTLGDVHRAVSPGLILSDLPELSREDLFKVYDHLWEYNLLDTIPDGLDYFMFDCGLVCGFTTVYRWLGMSLRLDDSKYDPERLSVLTRDLTSERVALLVSQLSFSRRRRHKAQAGWVKYGQRWTNRVNRVQRRAIIMCSRVQPKEELAYASG